MSSVSKGDLLEDLAHDMIKAELENNRLGVSADHSKLYKKHSYYSKDREKDIVVNAGPLGHPDRSTCGQQLKR